MRLPGVQYRGVRQLGRYDRRGPIEREAIGARAATGAAEALGAAGDIVDSIYETHAASQYDQLMSELSRKESELRSLVSSSPVLDPNVTPVPDWVEVETTETVVGADGREVTRPRVIPMWEVGSEVYDGTMRKLVGNVSDRASNPLARTQLARKSRDLVAQYAPAVKAKQLEHFKDHTKGLATLSSTDYIMAGDEQSARNVWLRMFHTGLIDGAELTDRLVEIGERIDEGIIVTQLQEATTEDELEALATQVTGMNRLDPATRQKYLDKIRSRSDKLNSEWKEDTREAALAIETRMVNAMYDDEYSLDILEGDTRQLLRLGKGDVATRMRKLWEAHQKARRGESRESDPDVLRILTQQAFEAAFPDSAGRTVDERVTAVRSRVSRAVGSGMLTPADGRSLMDELNASASLPYNGELYRQTTKSIWTELTGATEDDLFALRLAARERGDDAAVISLSEQAAVARRAQEDLMSYLRATGVEGNALDWWSRNRDRYSLETATKPGVEGFYTRFPEVGAESMPAGEWAKLDDSAKRAHALDRIRRRPSRAERVRLMREWNRALGLDPTDLGAAYR